MRRVSEHDPSARADTEQEGTLRDLTALVRIARRGFRRDVAQLVEALHDGALLVPLAKPLPGAEIGRSHVPTTEEVRLAPHLLANEQGQGLVALFSDADALRTVGQYAHWKTGEGPDLDYCTLPALAALDLALQLVDGERIVAAVINPADEHELVLLRHELGALCQQNAIPLVGYVSALPLSPDEQVLVADAGPVDVRLGRAIEGVLASHEDVIGHQMQHTFNAERDLEPHPTLKLRLRAGAALDRDALCQKLFAAVEGLLPEPGYIDVLFEEDS
jgi:hypothetical protein